MKIIRLVALGLCVLHVSVISTYGERATRDEGKAYTKGAYLQTTLKVVDVDGQPVTNAYVQAGYSSPKKGANWSKGYTDTNGLYTAKGHTRDTMTYRVTKDNYYKSTGGYNAWGKAKPQVLKDKWQPWNTTIPVVLKPMKNPVPMYVKRVKATIPVVGEPVGYDLLKGDWVAPHGKGKIADMTFTASGKFVAPLNREAYLTVSFSGKFNGIQEFKADAPESEFMSPHYAPTEGYESTWSYMRKVKPTREENVNTGEPRDLHFFLRIRSEVDEEGNLVKAMYGKIYNDIRCDFVGFYEPEQTMMIFFTYFLNPDYTTNIEFITGKGLFDTGSYKDDRFPLP